MHVIRNGPIKASVLRNQHVYNPGASAARCRSCWAAHGYARPTVAVERASSRANWYRHSSRHFVARPGRRADITRARDEMVQIQQMQQLEQQQQIEQRSDEQQRQRRKKKSRRWQQKAKTKNKGRAPSLGEIKEKLAAQIEYYFSDFMLPHTDVRLAAAIAADNDGWVPLEMIMRYPRVSELGQQVYDFGPSVVVDALSGSPLLEMNRVRSAVRRRYPFGEQGHDFVPLDEDERRLWRTLCAFKTAPVQQSSADDGAIDQSSGVGVVTVEMSFPPMTTEERAVVHRLAQILGLQHQSRGKGAKHQKQRYVIVRKRAGVVAQ